MKLVDSSVISKPVEIVLYLLNIVVTKNFFVFSYETVKFIRTPCICNKSSVLLLSWRLGKHLLIIRPQKYSRTFLGL